MRRGAAITGLGAVSAIGLDTVAMTASLREGRGGISRIAAFDVDGLRVQHAAELHGWRAAEHFSPAVAQRLDRTAQLGVVAARQAVADAAIPVEMLRSGRVALVWGVAAGGIGAPDGPGLGDVSNAFGTPGERDVLERFHDATLFTQTDAVAADLGITGPVLTHATACAASNSAIASGMALLRAGHADLVLVGGAEAWSRVIYAGFYSLGIMGEQPTSPFSRDTGATFGEGAGCMVLETPATARARNARLLGMLRGYGVTSDAHHITAPNPGGQGLARAMRLALLDAGLPSSAVGYINAHGTGTADNDVAETLAVHRVFDGHEPPVSSSKTFFGHTLGAAGILEFIASLLGMNGGFLPPTLNYHAPRVGCDLDYVPNVAREARFDAFLSISAAFGGVNVVAVGARADAASLEDAAAPTPSALPEIVVSGIGVVSPIGHGIEAFRAGLRAHTPCIRPITRFKTTGYACTVGALIEDLPARRLAPAADTRRMDAITRYAVVASTLALKDAGLGGRITPERIGLFVALSAGPVGSAKAFAEELDRGGIEALSAKYFPAIVPSILGGQIGLACQLRGASFTLADGTGAGLQALAHAYDFLQQHDELDAIVVVACDEIAAGAHRVQDRLGLLAPDGHSGLYDPDGTGIVPGEGSVALVLEKAPHLAARNARSYGRIAGVAFGSEGRCDEAVDESGATLAAVAARVLQGNLPDLAYGLARGAGRHDRREMAALRHLFGAGHVPVSSLNGQLGLAEATSGLYAAAAALLGLRHGEAYPAIGVAGPVAGLDVVQGSLRNADFRRALVLGSSEHGNSTAVLFSNES